MKFNLAVGLMIGVLVCGSFLPVVALQVENKQHHLNCNNDGTGTLCVAFCRPGPWGNPERVNILYLINEQGRRYNNFEWEGDLTFGDYTYYDLPIGKYTLHAKKLGYKRITDDNVIIEEGKLTGKGYYLEKIEIHSNPLFTLFKMDFPLLRSDIIY